MRVATITCSGMLLAAAVCSASAADMPVYKAPPTLPYAQGEVYFGLQIGGAFGARGTNLKALEDLNYPEGPPDLYAATGSNLKLESSLLVGIKAGYYFASLPGFGVEFDGHYTRPNFPRQNVTITLANSPIPGISAFTEDQLPADFHMFTGSFNLMYRFGHLGVVRPYIGAGPAFYGLRIRGTGTSCRIIDPPQFADDFCPAGEMRSSGSGVGVNAKAGLEVPISRHISFDIEYKFNYGHLKVDWFRSFSDISVDYTAHLISGGLRFRY